MATMTTIKRSAVATPVVAVGGEVAEVPIFLQKAYHMIDTCDPDICCWSEDGLTFIVKNTNLFETTIIPQFFKHNKFSSFVRQLNFYGFRKVKFSNSLRIDRELEAETSKFWRFRHESFRRGREDLLTEIRRMPSASSSSSSSPSSTALSTQTAAAAGGGSVAVVPTLPTLPSVTPLETAMGSANGSHLETEMRELRQRVASMSKSIDELTDLIKTVTVKEDAGPLSVVSPRAARVESEGVKNAEYATLPPRSRRGGGFYHGGGFMPDWAPSSSEFGGMDDAMEFSAMIPLPDLASSSSSSSSTAPSPAPSDEDFVDDLFEAFAVEDSAFPGLEGELENDASDLEGPNRPDPQLMKRIEDSLSTIPRDMHEMVANRLIDAISNARPIAESASYLFPPPPTSSRQVGEGIFKADRSISVDEGDVVVDEDSAAVASPATTVVSSSIPLPLAVATLKTILSEYGVSVECTRRAYCKDAYAVVEGRRMFTKSLPILPMHA